MWLDIACLVFVCVTANHLGLINAIEDIVKKEIPIANCPKCFTFWSVLAYGVIKYDSSLLTIHSSLTLLAISFLCAYLAIWIELLEGFIDILYMWLYEKIYPNSQNDTPAADADNCDSASTVSNM